MNTSQDVRVLSSSCFGHLIRSLLILLAGCATVAPQQRGFLADPTMQFDAEARHDAGLRHAIENREGSMGGTGVSGGGCGCN